MYYKHLNNQPLQSFYQIEIETKGDSKVVTFHSKIHVNKVNKCTITFSTKFTDSEILKDNDLISWVINSYGDVWLRGY